MDYRFKIRVLPVAPERDFVREAMVTVLVYDGDANDRPPRLFGAQERQSARAHNWISVDEMSASCVTRAAQLTGPTYQ